MTSKIIDGRAIAQQERLRIEAEVQNRLNQGKRRPGLAVLLVGQDGASQIYVKNKREACQAVGFHSTAYDFPATVSEKELLHKIDELNHNHEIDGILVQLPLPEHISSQKVLEAIDPLKDVDGFHPYNIGKLAQKQPGLRPCTPVGVMNLLATTDIIIPGSEVCIVGASLIVGRPMLLELLNRDATVTVCHSLTRDVSAHVVRADIVIVAAGKPNLIQGNWIKEGACVIDIGINRLSDGKIVGDVDFNAAIQRASWITPVPGGVGPMTITALLNNTLMAARLAED